MTVNITVLTRSAIYVSADYRLYNNTAKQPEPEPSTKAITISGPEWLGFITYTGVGKVTYDNGRITHTAEFVRSWLSRAPAATFAEVADVLRRQGSRWISHVAPGKPHTFVLAGFPDDMATVAIVSNFEGWNRQPTPPQAEFVVTTNTASAEPQVLVTGTPAAVPRQRRRSLQRQVIGFESDPAAIRRALAAANRDAARIAPNTISTECFVHSQNSDGTGYEEVFGHAQTDIPYTLPSSLRDLVVQHLDDFYGKGSWGIKAATFSSGAASSDAPAACVPEDAHPEPSSGYQLIPLEMPEGRRAQPVAVNNAGIAAGDAVIAWRGSSYPCLWTTSGRLEVLPHLSQLGGQARAINSAAVAVGNSETFSMRDPGTPERRSRACRWTLGSTQVADIVGNLAPRCGANSINDRGDVAGWISMHPEDGSQDHFRPALWPSEGDAHTWTDIEGWGEAVHVDDEGRTLLHCHQGSTSYVQVWDGIKLRRPAALPSGMPQIRAFYAKAILSSGAIIGGITLHDSSRHIAFVDEDDRWTVLRPPRFGYELADANASGDLVGYFQQDDYELPWLRLSGGDAFVMLPYFRRHHCRALAISPNGLIVGTAQADNCMHPLLWRPAGDGSTSNDDDTV